MSSVTPDMKGRPPMTLAIRSVTFPQSAETGAGSTGQKARLLCEGRIGGVEVEMEILFPWPLFDERPERSDFRTLGESCAATHIARELRHG